MNNVHKAKIIQKKSKKYSQLVYRRVLDQPQGQENRRPFLQDTVRCTLKEREGQGQFRLIFDNLIVHIDTSTHFGQLLDR